MEKPPNPESEVKKSPAFYHLWTYILLTFFCIGMFYGRNLSGDVWWHLKTGQWIVQNHAFPYTDPFSYTARNPIIFQEWGAQSAEWLLYSISPSLLAFTAVFLISSAFALSYRMAADRSRSIVLAFVITAIGASASADWSEMRPQVFSFVFFALMVWILQRFHERGSKVIWLLAPLTLLWANFHGVFMVLFALVIMEIAVSVIVPPSWAIGAKRPRLAAALPLAVVGVFSALSALINPNGLELYLYPFRLMRHPDTTRLLNEWTPPSLAEWTGRSLVLLFALAVLGIAVQRGRVKLRDLAYVVVLGTGSIMSRRHGVLFAIACAPILCLWLSGSRNFLRDWFERHRLRRQANAVAVIIIVGFTVSLLTWRIADARGYTPFDYMNQTEVFPQKACDYLDAQDLKGPLFNDFNYGGYLIWRLWPEHKVFVDSRGEPFFGGSFEESVAVLSSNPPGIWRDIFRKHGINTAIIHPDMPLVAELSNEADWSLVYSDERAVIFTRDEKQ